MWRGGGKEERMVGEEERREVEGCGGKEMGRRKGGIT